MAFYNPYNGYNPVNPYMPQMAPQMPVQAPQSVPVQQTINNTPPVMRCVPVTSRAEVDGFQIPFDGSTTYFADTSNGKIYAKTFNFNNGTAPVVTYIRETDVPVPQYATMDDLKALREEFLSATKKAVKKNDAESVDE